MVTGNRGNPDTLDQEHTKLYNVTLNHISLTLCFSCSAHSKHSRYVLLPKWVSILYGSDVLCSDRNRLLPLHISGCNSTFSHTTKQVRVLILMETLTHRGTHMNAYQKAPLESELSRHKNPFILYAFYSP